MKSTIELDVFLLTKLSLPLTASAYIFFLGFLHIVVNQRTIDWDAERSSSLCVERFIFPGLTW